MEKDDIIIDNFAIATEVAELCKIKGKDDERDQNRE